VESNDFFLGHLRAAPVITVLRGAGAEYAVRIAESCWEAGVVLVEVSRSHDEAFEAVRAVCERASSLGRIAGAGTVSTAEDVGAAVAAGAGFAAPVSRRRPRYRQRSAMGFVRSNSSRREILAPTGSAC
jgi:2-dehydro-3-deoxyphosphogluconate aldolase/(4S)-4-hydroxy-2-oxoglutarate aldolase